MKQEKNIPEQSRMQAYNVLAAAFSYPDERFFALFPGMKKKKETIVAEYDRLFRTGRVFLYGAEAVSENEFQRVRLLADITGFYRAFGVEPQKDRPDSVPGELEFMSLLIFKTQRVFENKGPEEKAGLCLKAQRDFFAGHIYPEIKKVAEKISAQTKIAFYKEKALELLRFIETEKQIFL